MAELLQGDASKVIGGPARLLIAASTYPMPSRISEIVSLSTYAVNSSYGWQDVGFTEVGITQQREVNTKDWRTDQFGLLKRLPLDYQSMLTTRAMQTTQANKQNLMQASVGSANGASENVTYFEAAPFLTAFRAAVVMQDEFGKFHARVFPHVQWDGKAIKELFERATPDTIDFSFVAFPDSTIAGPNGFATDRIDFDQ